MEKILVIGDRETVLGFQLVGVEGLECSAESSEKVVSEIVLGMAEKKVSLLVLQESFLDKYSQKTKNFIDSTAKVVVVTIPSKRGGSTAESQDFAKMVKKAIGVELK